MATATDVASVPSRLPFPGQWLVTRTIRRPPNTKSSRAPPGHLMISSPRLSTLGLVRPPADDRAGRRPLGRVRHRLKSAHDSSSTTRPTDAKSPPSPTPTTTNLVANPGPRRSSDVDVDTPNPVPCHWRCGDPDQAGGAKRICCNGWLRSTCS
jgi:hypothetical protein